MAQKDEEGPGEDWLIRFTKALSSYDDIKRLTKIIKKWCSMRETIIDELKKLKDSLSAAHSLKNYAEVCSGFVTLVGSFFSIIGQISRIFGLVNPKFVRMIAERGREGVIIGRLSNYAASGSENAFQWYSSTKITSLLQKDKENTAILLDTVNLTAEFVKVVEEVMDFDIFLKINMYLKNGNRNLYGGKNLPPQALHMIQSLRIPKTAKTKIENIARVVYQSVPFRDALCALAPISWSTVCHDVCNLKHKFCIMSTTESISSIAEETYDMRTFNGCMNTAQLALKVIDLLDTYQTTLKKYREMNTESDLIKKLQKCIDLMQEELDTVKSLQFDAVFTSNDDDDVFTSNDDDDVFTSDDDGVLRMLFAD